MSHPIDIDKLPLTERMIDALIDALRHESHYVFGHGVTVQALVRRELAAHEDSGYVRLTPLGQEAAADQQERREIRSASYKKESQTLRERRAGNLLRAGFTTYSAKSDRRDEPMILNRFDTEHTILRSLAKGARVTQVDTKGAEIRIVMPNGATIMLTAVEEQPADNLGGVSADDAMAVEDHRPEGTRPTYARDLKKGMVVHDGAFGFRTVEDVKTNTSSPYSENHWTWVQFSPAKCHDGSLAHSEKTSNPDFIWFVLVDQPTSQEAYSAAVEAAEAKTIADGLRVRAEWEAHTCSTCSIPGRYCDKGMRLWERMKRAESRRLTPYIATNRFGDRRGFWELDVAQAYARINGGKITRIPGNAEEDNPLDFDPIPAGGQVLANMPGREISRETLSETPRDFLTHTLYVMQLRSEGQWLLPNHDDGAFRDRGQVAWALRRTVDYWPARPGRISQTDDGTVYVSNGKQAARYIPAGLMRNHTAGTCPGCGTDYATNGDGPCTGREKEPEEGFYVTARNGKRTTLLLGPYGSKEKAEANVDRARKYSEKNDPRGWFYAYGTAKGTGKPGRKLPAGVLNRAIGLEPAEEVE